jgi:hypothetical protein
MKHIKLFEQFINEKKIDDAQINQQIAEFHKLQMRIMELESELKQKKAEFKNFDDQIQPIITGMKETGDKLAVTESHVVKISRFGYDRATASYKDAFEMALSKVNASTKKILEEALVASTKVSKVSASYSIDSKITEANILQKLVSSIKKIVSDFMNIFKKESKEIDSANNELKALEKTQLYEGFFKEKDLDYEVLGILQDENDSMNAKHITSNLPNRGFDRGVSVKQVESSLERLVKNGAVRIINSAGKKEYIKKMYWD